MDKSDFNGALEGITDFVSMIFNAIMSALKVLPSEVTGFIIIVLIVVALYSKARG